MFWDGLEIDKKRRKEGKKQTQKDKNKQNKKKKKSFCSRFINGALAFQKDKFVFLGQTLDNSS